MKKHILAMLLALASTVAALPANSAEPAQSDQTAEPAKSSGTMTLIAGKTKKPQLFLFGKRASFDWQGSEAMTKVGSEFLAKQGYEPVAVRVYGVNELYLGPADKFTPAEMESAGRISRADLMNIPPGAKQVIQLRAYHMGMGAFETITISFDELPADELRRIAFNEGVLRVFGFRD